MTFYFLAETKTKVMHHYRIGNEVWPILFDTISDALAYAHARCPDHVAYPITESEAKVCVIESGENGCVVMNRYGKILRRWRRS